MAENIEKRKIAVEFDGTNVEDRYPAIGRERPFALQTLRELQKRGFTLVLWTCRTGKELEEAVEFCRKGGVTFFGVNECFEGELYSGVSVPRKIDADIYIDDRNIGGLPSWGVIYQKLTGQDPSEQEEKPKAGGLRVRLAKLLLGEKD